MITFDKFSIAPMKVRILYIKKLLNVLGYNLEETFYDDKYYKRALKKFQIENNFTGNCVVTSDVFDVFINKIPEANKIWKDMR